MRNLLTSAVFEKTFKASDKFKEPDLQIGPASYLYSDKDGSHFLDQETLRNPHSQRRDDRRRPRPPGRRRMIELHKYNGNPDRHRTADACRADCHLRRARRAGDSSSGSVTKIVKLETGLEIRVPLFIKEGEKVKVSTDTREFAGRA